MATAMGTATVKFACEHKRRITLHGNAAARSAQMFHAQFVLCEDCKAERGNCPTCGERLLEPFDAEFCENCFQEFGR